MSRTIKAIERHLRPRSTAESVEPPENYGKAAMDYIMDWKLIHRTEEEMDQLFQSSRFGRPCTQIRFEPEGINLFAECIKE